MSELNNTPVPDNTPDTPAPLVNHPIIKKRQWPIDEARKAKYIEGLRQSASHRFASMYATPNGTASTDKKQPGHAYSSFAELRRRDPEFKAACDEALACAIGELEASCLKRATTPDIRRQWDAKTGVMTGESIGWMPANALARAILARWDNDWIERSRVDGTVTHSHSVDGAGAAYVVKLDDINECLDDDQRRQLLGLLTVLEDHREQKRLEQKQITDQSQGE